MNKTEDEEALARLRQAGCTPGEIARFRQLRQAYRAQHRRRGKLRPVLLRWLEGVGKLLPEGMPSIPWE
jgi:hypothetical protein